MKTNSEQTNNEEKVNEQTNNEEKVELGSTGSEFSEIDHNAKQLAEEKERQLAEEKERQLAEEKERQLAEEKERQLAEEKEREKSRKIAKKLKYAIEKVERVNQELNLVDSDFELKADKIDLNDDKMQAIQAILGNPFFSKSNKVYLTITTALAKIFPTANFQKPGEGGIQQNIIFFILSSDPKIVEILQVGNEIAKLTDPAETKKFLTEYIEKYIEEYGDLETKVKGPENPITLRQLFKNLTATLNGPTSTQVDRKNSITIFFAQFAIVVPKAILAQNADLENLREGYSAKRLKEKERIKNEILTLAGVVKSTRANNEEEEVKGEAIHLDKDKVNEDVKNYLQKYFDIISEYRRESDYDEGHRGKEANNIKEPKVTDLDSLYYQMVVIKESLKEEADKNQRFLELCKQVLKKETLEECEKEITNELREKRKIEVARNNLKYLVRNCKEDGEEVSFENELNFIVTVTVKKSFFGRYLDFGEKIISQFLTTEDKKTFYTKEHTAKKGFVTYKINLKELAKKIPNEKIAPQDIQEALYEELEDFSANDLNEELNNFSTNDLNEELDDFLVNGLEENYVKNQGHRKQKKSIQEKAEALKQKEARALKQKEARALKREEARALKQKEARALDEAVDKFIVNQENIKTLNDIVYSSCFHANVVENHIIGFEKTDREIKKLAKTTDHKEMNLLYAQIYLDRVDGNVEAGPHFYADQELAMLLRFYVAAHAKNTKPNQEIVKVVSEIIAHHSKVTSKTAAFGSYGVAFNFSDSTRGAFNIFAAKANLWIRAESEEIKGLEKDLSGLFFEVKNFSRVIDLASGGKGEEDKTKADSMGLKVILSLKEKATEDKKSFDKIVKILSSNIDDEEKRKSLFELADVWQGERNKKLIEEATKEKVKKKESAKSELVETSLFDLIESADIAGVKDFISKAKSDESLNSFLEEGRQKIVTRSNFVRSTKKEFTPLEYAEYLCDKDKTKREGLNQIINNLKFAKLFSEVSIVREESVRNILNNTKNIKEILEQGTNYFDLLNLALKKNAANIADLLLEQNVDEDIIRRAIPTNTKTPLHRAAKSGNLEFCEKFIQKFPNLIPFQDECGWTALHHAANDGKVKVVKLLCNDHNLINIQDKWGFTALHLAANNGKVEVVRLLLDSGADKTIKTDGGLTAGKIASDRLDRLKASATIDRKVSATKEYAETKENMQEILELLEPGLLKEFQDWLKSQWTTIVDKWNNSFLAGLCCGTDAAYNVSNESNTNFNSSDENKEEVSKEESSFKLSPKSSVEPTNYKNLDDANKGERQP